MASVEKLLTVIQNSKSDTEKLSSLMFIVKFSSSKNFSVVDQERLFNAIDNNFLVRLLNTRDKAEEKIIFPVVAVNIIAALIDGVILTQGTCVSLGQALISLVKDVYCQQLFSVDMKSEIADRCLYCISVIAAMENGSTALAEIKILAQLESIYTEIETAYQYIAEVIVSTTSEVAWKNNTSSLNRLIAVHTAYLSDDKQFKVVISIHKLIASLDSSFLLEQPEWAPQLCTAIVLMLKKKLEKLQRDVLIEILAISINIFGICLLVPSNFLEEKHKELPEDFRFVTCLSCIESRLVLQVDGWKSPANRQLLAASYLLLESCLKWIIENTEVIENSFLVQSVAKLYDQILEVVKAIIDVMEEIVKSDDKELLFACCRFLGCWLSEETQQLQDQVIKIIPVLLYASKLSQEVFFSLLPGIFSLVCNLELIQIMLDEGLSEVLLIYLNNTQQFCVNAVTSILIRVLSVPQHAPLFTKLVTILAEGRISYLDNPFIAVNVTLSCLMIDQQLPNLLDSSVVLQLIQFMQAVSRKLQDKFNETIELHWHKCVVFYAARISDDKSGIFTKALIDSCWVIKLVKMLDKCEVASISLLTVASYETLFVSCLNCSELRKIVMPFCHVFEKFKMGELSKALACI